VIRVPEEEKEGRVKKILENIIAENFSGMTKEIK
jgi:hypothetical protein